MKILGICGSPRRHGNTDALLNEALRGAADSGGDIEKISVCDLAISPCSACYRCYKNGQCAVADDMQTVYKKFGEADIIIVASPIYFGSVTAQLKAMVDRFQCFWVSKYILKKKRPSLPKKGLAILTQSSRRRNSFDNAEMIIRNLFAALDIKFSGSLRIAGMGNKSETVDNRRIVKAVYNMGKKIIR